MSVLKKTVWHATKEIQPGLWQIVFHVPSSTNCYLWQDSDGLTLIDAGFPWSADAILDSLRRIGQPLRKIVITHAHPDHAGAAAEVSHKTGVQVFAHSADIPYLQGRAMSDLPGFWLCRAVLNTGRRFGILNAPSIPNVGPITDGEMIGQLQVLHTPGHTPGSISLWSPEKKSLFCGDNICSMFSSLQIGVPWFTLDLASQRDSLSRYQNLPAKFLLSGHGPAYYGDFSREIQRLVKYEP